MRHDIKNYRFGRIEVDGKKYDSDIIITPNKIIHPWWRKEGHLLTCDDIFPKMPENTRMLIVGTGSPGMMKVNENVKKECQERNIKLIALPTAKAVDEYNKNADDKTVCAFHLTC